MVVVVVVRTVDRGHTGEWWGNARRFYAAVIGRGRAVGAREALPSGLSTAFGSACGTRPDFSGNEPGVGSDSKKTVPAPPPFLSAAFLRRFLLN